MEEKIVAVVKRPYQKPEITTIKKGLTPLQELVGGTITAADLPDMDEVYGYCNDEGLLIGLEPNFYRPEYKDAIVGTAVFVGGDNGRSVSLSSEQAKKIVGYLEKNSVNDLGEFVFNVKTNFAFYKPKSASCM